MSGLYKGYSSHQYEYNKSLRLSDIEVVKRDLLNHIFTRFGERVMLPEFGTRIPDLLFEPLDDITITMVESDLRDVFEYDPRVELVDMAVSVDYDNNSMTVSAILNYLELDLNDIFDLNLQFDI
jgi:phage baseplate assembly protein W